MQAARAHLDQLFAVDALASVVIGVFALGAPHGWWEYLGGSYSHSVHETLRLYGCLRLACGWILWHVRRVDDGIFRRHVCEALLVCYVLQALAVGRAQFTDRSGAPAWINGGAILFLTTLSVAYGSFRYGKGGNLIKVYELPTSSNLR